MCAGREALLAEGLGAEDVGADQRCRRQADDRPEEEAERRAGAEQSEDAADRSLATGVQLGRSAEAVHVAVDSGQEYNGRCAG